MPRLPQPGQDAGTWGEILNEFLSESLASDGTLNADTVNAAQLKSGAVVTAALANNAVTGVKLADGTIEESKLHADVRTKLNIGTPGAANGIATLDGGAKLPENQVPTRLSEDGLQSTIASTIAESDTVQQAAADAVDNELSGRNIPNGETIEPDEFRVRFDDGDPFLQADESRGLFSKITHQPDSVPTSALVTMNELTDDQGWVFVIRGTDKRAIFGKRTDGSWYPSSFGDEDSATLTPITIHGDSLTAGWASYTGALSTALGRTVSARGNGGHTSKWIAVRQGGQPMLVTVDGGTIPASGSTTVTLEFGTTIGTTTGLPSATGTYPGVLGSIAGSLQITDSGVGTFTRSSAGRATPITAKSPYTTGYTWRDSLPIFWAGRNNFKLANDGDQVVSDLRAMMAWTRRTDRALILSIPPWVGEEIGTGVRNTLNTVNAKIRDAFPTAYLDSSALLRSEAMLQAVGITPTATDLDNITNGLTPESFRSDSGHFNAKGYEALNILIQEAYAARGWMED